MNTIITLRRLVEILAKHVGCDNYEAEKFFKAFTSQLSEQLSKHESVSIKGLGEFNVNDDNRIVFIPDASIASAVNAPFEMFSAEKLDSDIGEEQINAPYTIPVSEPISEPEPKPVTTVAPEEAEETQANPPAPKPAPVPVEIPVEETVAAEKVEYETSVKAAEPAPAPTPAEEKAYAPQPSIKPWDDEPEPTAEDTQEEPSYIPEQASHGFPWFWTVIGMVLGLIIGIALGFFAHDPIMETLEPSLAQEEEYIDPTELDELAAIFAEDSISAAAPAEEVEPQSSENQPVQPAATETVQEPTQQVTAPAQESKQDEIYETIRSGTNLAKLARKHYGHNVYWVYIYLENKDVIPNPNRVPEGVRVKIPPLSKYATQASDEDRKAAAQKKVSEVLAKYPR